MTAIFLIAHAPLASALRAVALHAYPDRAATLACYDVPPGADTERYRAEAEAALAALGAAEVLILCDAPGATPGNLAQALARSPGRVALAGVNVPMLWRALNYADLPPAALARRAEEGARACVLTLQTSPPQQQPKAAPMETQHAQDARHHQQ